MYNNVEERILCFDHVLLYECLPIITPIKKARLASHTYSVKLRMMCSMVPSFAPKVGLIQKYMYESVM